MIAGLLIRLITTQSRCPDDSGMPSRITLVSFNLTGTRSRARARESERERERENIHHIRLGRPISVIILPVSLSFYWRACIHANASSSTLETLYQSVWREKKKKKNHVSSRWKRLKPLKGQCSFSLSLSPQQDRSVTRKLMMTRAPVLRSYNPGLVQIDVTVVPLEGFRTIVDDMDCTLNEMGIYVDISMKFLIFNLSLMIMINMINDFWVTKYLSQYLIFKERVISIIQGLRMTRGIIWK